MPINYYNNFIRSKNFALFVLAVAVFMGSIDASIVNIALPTMSKFFAAGLAKVQWVATIYGLGIVALLPLGSKLGNRYGQNKINSLGYILFGIGSLLCAISHGLWGLVAARFVQAAGAAMLFSLGQGIVATIFTGVKRGGALGVIGASVALGNITGPSLGGFLLDSFGWQSIFLINLPVAVFGAYYSWRVLPALKRKKLGRIDGISLLYFMAASTLLVGGLALSESIGILSPRILVMLALVPGFAALLYRREKKAKSPLLNIALYKNKVFALGNLAFVFIFMSMGINVILIPFCLQDIYGLSALKTGALILFYSVAMVVTAPVAGRLSGKYGSKKLMFFGCCLTITGFVWYMNLGTVYHEYQIIFGQIIMGIGNALFQSPNNNSIMAAVPRRFYNDASAQNSLARNIGIASGIAMTVNVFEALRGHFLTAQNIAADAAFMKAYRHTLGLGVVLVVITMAISTLRDDPLKRKN